MTDRLPPYKPHMTMDHSCTEYACKDAAYFLFVYGCLDGHVRERILCYNHGQNWVVDKAMNKIHCSQCLEPIDSYQVGNVNEIKAWK